VSSKRQPRPASVARSVTTVVIGAGHAGLAISRGLGERSIDHVVLERGEVANSWRRERWDSLKLLTPNWLSRLPGQRYDGPDPDGYMSMPQVIDFIDSYAQRISAPIETGTTVTSVSQVDGGYLVASDKGSWSCEAVVLASGAFSKPVVPALAAALPESIASVTPNEYRNPNQLESGGVLVVGASATGLQLAHEIQCSGRPVTLAAGSHVRMPRLYRGRDIQWWMDATGVLDEGLDDVDDVTRVRRVPSPQLVGTPERKTLDLNSLRELGVRVVGRLTGIRDRRAQFSGSLRNACQLADLKMNRLLDAIDEWSGGHGTDDMVEEPQRFEPTRVDASPCLGFDLSGGEIRSVIWATGFRPDYSWLDVPVLDRKGQVRHEGGVAATPGLYLMGLPFLRRRKSSFIHGAEDDARDLCDHLVGHLDRQRANSKVSLAC
jgi:putative flavoprotein involved in K+ transport